MARAKALTACAAALASVPLLAADPAPVPPFEVPDDGRIAAAINGRAVTLYSTPGMPSGLYVSKALAGELFGPEGAAIKKKSGFLISLQPTGARIGPVRIAGKAENADLTIGATAAKARVQWFEQDAYDLGEALAGPYALPYPVVTYRLRPSVAGERVTQVKLEGRNMWWLATTPREFEGKTVHFALAPHFPTTVMSAAAGRVISASHGGRMSGEAVKVPISHGVQRPARLLRFDRPLEIGGLRIGTAMVRTVDYGSVGSIVDEDAVDPSESSDDIVVTGKRKASKPSYVVYIGADALAGCSTLTYDKPAKTISMSCRP